MVLFVPSRHLKQALETDFPPVAHQAGCRSQRHACCPADRRLLGGGCLEGLHERLCSRLVSLYLRSCSGRCIGSCVASRSRFWCWSWSRRRCGDLHGASELVDMHMPRGSVEPDSMCNMSAKLQVSLYPVVDTNSLIQHCRRSNAKQIGICAPEP